jgi:hypothetical protein
MNAYRQQYLDSPRQKTSVKASVALNAACASLPRIPYPVAHEATVESLPLGCRITASRAMPPNHIETHTSEFKERIRKSNAVIVIES